MWWVCACTYIHVWICPRTGPAAQETTASVSYDERTNLHPTLARQSPKAPASWCKAHSKFLVGTLSRVTLHWKIRLGDTSYHKWLCLMICAGKGPKKEKKICGKGVEFSQKGEIGKVGSSFQKEEKWIAPHIKIKGRPMRWPLRKSWTLKKYPIFLCFL